MSDHKIIFFGPVGAGKSTAIRSVSEIDCIDTDVRPSDTTSSRKQATTVAMDYGRLTTETSQQIHLYGTPGQQRFQFMWELISTELAADCCGQILLLDNSRNYPRQDLEFYIREFNKLVQNKPLIIAVTRSDISPSPDQSDYQGWLSELDVKAPLYFVDARNPDDILFLINEALISPTYNPINEVFNSKAFIAPQHPKTAAPQVTPTTLIPVSDEEFSLDQVLQHCPDPIQLSPSVVSKIQGLQGVTGIALIDSLGQLTTMKLCSRQLDQLIRFTTVIPPLLARSDSLSNLQSLTLNSDKGDNLSLFIADQNALAVFSTEQLSSLNLRQQVENILQWQSATAT